MHVFEHDLVVEFCFRVISSSPRTSIRTVPTFFSVHANKVAKWKIGLTTKKEDLYTIFYRPPKIAKKWWTFPLDGINCKTSPVERYI